METSDIKLVQDENIETLNQILNAYRGAERKNKLILELVLVVCVAALYFALFDLLGGLWGFILTIVILFIGVLCIEKLGITFKNAPESAGKLAYQACVAMWVLIEIKKGNYRTDISNVIGVSSGTHLSLYREFIQLYPTFASKELEKLSKINVDRKDMFS